MRIHFYIAAALLVASTSTLAQIEPIMLNVSTTEHYTVPMGKVLVIQNVNAPSSSSLILSKGGTTNILSDNFFKYDQDRSFVSYPLILPEGTYIRSGRYSWAIFGVLVDPEDLYVGVDHSLDDVENISAVAMNLKIRTVSARPVRFEVETTESLQTAWSRNTDATVTPTQDRKEYDLTVPTSGGGLFVRTRARPRR
jgi:hypothetical protein